MNNFFKASDDVRKSFKGDWSRSKARTDLLHGFIKEDIINKGTYYSEEENCYYNIPQVELEKH